MKFVDTTPTIYRVRISVTSTKATLFGPSPIELDVEPKPLRQIQDLILLSPSGKGNVLGKLAFAYAIRIRDKKHKRSFHQFWCFQRACICLHQIEIKPRLLRSVQLRACGRYFKRTLSLPAADKQPREKESNAPSQTHSRPPLPTAASSQTHARDLRHSPTSDTRPKSLRYSSLQPASRTPAASTT